MEKTKPERHSYASKDEAERLREQSRRNQGRGQTDSKEREMLRKRKNDRNNNNWPFGASEQNVQDPPKHDNLKSKPAEQDHS